MMPDSPPIRTLIADDEPLARRGIALLLNDQPDIEVVGTCADGADAVRQIQLLQPDLLFLDIQMPVCDGFEVIQAVGVETVPVVVFVTAFDQHALRAFDAHALDYLLKPYDDERFHHALQRARQQVKACRAGQVDTRLYGLLQDAAPAFWERLAVKSTGRVQFVEVETIDWIEGAGDYVGLHVAGHVLYHRERLSTLADHLDPRHFVRIHRSAIVNRSRIQERRVHPHGGYIVRLTCGTELKVSRGYAGQLLAES